jgi:hypothetical protein
MILTSSSFTLRAVEALVEAAGANAEAEAIREAKRANFIIVSVRQ